jgi:hypothetical protein
VGKSDKCCRVVCEGLKEGIEKMAGKSGMIRRLRYEATDSTQASLLFVKA